MVPCDGSYDLLSPSAAHHCGGKLSTSRGLALFMSDRHIRWNGSCVNLFADSNLVCGSVSIPQSRRKIIRRGKILSFDVCGHQETLRAESKRGEEKKNLEFLSFTGPPFLQIFHHAFEVEKAMSPPRESRCSRHEERFSLCIETTSKQQQNSKLYYKNRMSPRRRNCLAGLLRAHPAQYRPIFN